MSNYFHALAIFLGAFLLFLVQPLQGKFLLPWFGGSPGVWTTCLMFFQVMLLGGYAYAHGLTRMVPLRQQGIVHLGLLTVSLSLMPYIPSLTWQPGQSAEPIGSILQLLLTTVGLPYLLLSASSPLFQHWFNQTNRATEPYRLYAVSNAGSLFALVGFPLVFEPLMSRQALAWSWSAGLVLFTGLCAIHTWRMTRTAIPADPPPADNPTEHPRPSSLDLFLWLALSASASLLLAATTNKLCLDIAAMPFVWVLPLGIYLLSFMLCFDHPRWSAQRWWGAVFAVGCIANVHPKLSTSVFLPAQVLLHTLTLLAGCMLCHGELYRLKPAPHRLTHYFLTIATGGALGTGFVVLVAPMLFDDYRELPLGLFMVGLLCGIIELRQRPLSLGPSLVAGLIGATIIIPAFLAESGRGLVHWLQDWGRAIGVLYLQSWPVVIGIGGLAYFSLQWKNRSFIWTPVSADRRRAIFTLICALLLGLVFLKQAGSGRSELLATGRNFFGAYKVHHMGESTSISRYTLLSHGGTTHGLQLLHPPYNDWPTSYYGRTSGVGRVITSLPAQRRIGLIGLGAGTLATYGRVGDTFRFYEINPAIVEVANKDFSFLKHTMARIEHVPGDARLAMETELRQGAPQEYDLLVLDAFNGDAIPIHLLTAEALDIYRRHLRPGGFLAFHISNRHLDLRPVIEALAQHGGLHFATISDNVSETDWWLYHTKWMILCGDPDRLRGSGLLEHAEEPPDATAKIVLWTDDRASLLNVLK